MDLFSELRGAASPLANRMRPVDWDEFLGQSKILGPGKALRLWIENNKLPSLILWGPPGCGKTTLAHIISKRCQALFGAHFVSLSAVSSGVKDIKAAAQEAQARSAKTILFVDEIHRFNKGQQDALLPYVEDGTFVLIGATTENPSFELNSALLSRTKVIRLERLTTEDLAEILQRALASERVGHSLFLVSDEVVQSLAAMAEGDARRALGNLDNLLSLLKLERFEGRLSLADFRERMGSLGERDPLPHDRAGEEHYNVVSALTKCLRASDVNAALYYLARMIEAGEDAVFICRRLVIFAAEDVGNADPRALLQAVAALHACQLVGMPEGRIVLGQAVSYLALAPKSNSSYVAIDAALAEVRSSGALPVPFHLRNAAMRSAATPSNFPKGLKEKNFYEPKEIGSEKLLKQRMTELEQDLKS